MEPLQKAGTIMCTQVYNYIYIYLRPEQMSEGNWFGCKCVCECLRVKLGRMDTGTEQA